MHLSLIVAIVSTSGANSTGSTSTHTSHSQSDSHHTQFQLYRMLTTVVVLIHGDTSHYSELQQVLILSGVTVTTTTTSGTINTNKLHVT